MAAKRKFSATSILVPTLRVGTALRTLCVPCRRSTSVTRLGRGAAVGAFATRSVGTRRFCALLVLLIASGGFAWNDEVDPAALAERRKAIEQMTPAEKEDLRRRQKQFSELPLAEQERLRKLHRELEKDPDGKALQAVMGRYHEWCKQVSRLQRDDLLMLTPEKRIAKIQELLADENANKKTRDEYRLPSEDLEAIVAWLEEHLNSRLAALPEDTRVKFLSLAPGQRRASIGGMLRQRPPGSPRLFEPTAEEIENLRQRLSTESQAKLARRESHEAKRELLLDWWNGWIAQAVRDAQRKYFDSLLAEVPNLDQELVKFFEGLPVKERNSLLERPGESWQSLRTMYVHKQMADKLPPFMRVPENFGGGPRRPFEGLPRRSGDSRPGDARQGDGRPGDGRTGEARPSEGRANEGLPPLPGPRQAPRADQR